jgi:hypothetical protein
MRKSIVLFAVLIALSPVQAADTLPAPQAGEGQIILKQYTRVALGTSGTTTMRHFTVTMRVNGTDRILSTPQDIRWQLTEGDWHVMESPLIDTTTFSARGMGPYQQCKGRRRLDGASLGKRLEDGVNVVGEWMNVECNATAERPSWIERNENWSRIDVVNGQKMLRPHRREVKSQYEHKRIDYTYLSTSRLHLSLFDEKLP